MPFEPFPVAPGASQGGPLDPGTGTGGSGVSMAGSQRSQSKEERQQWEAARSQPKRDFTVYQRQPERKKMPYKRLLPRLEVLSVPPERYRVKPDSDRDPFKVSEGAKRAVASEWLEKLAKPRSYPNELTKPRQGRDDLL